MDATPEQRAEMVRNSVAVLAQVHRIDPTNADLTFVATVPEGTSAMTAQLDAQRSYYEWAREDVTYPLIERTFAWLEAHQPEDRPTVLNWGDSRIGNMIYRDFTPVAVLDWEMAGLGPREVDVAWMIFLHRFFQDLAEVFELPGIPFFRRADVTRIYEAASGHTIRDLEWFIVYAGLRYAIVMSQVKR